MEHHHQFQDQETTAAGGIGFQFPTNADGYKILSQIGVSDHSTVYMAICKSIDSTIVAVKVINIQVNIDPISIMNIKSLSLINHANILSPHCCFFADDGRLWIVMPFIHSGPLQAIVSNRFPSGLPDQFMAILLNQLLRGLVCLHEMGYVHKAIKASNIFFDSQGTVKLSDLSISNSTDDDNEDDNKSSISVPYWAPPEYEYSFKTDVWSIGILAMEIAYGGPPISDSRIVKSQMMNIARRFPYDLNLDKKSGKSVIDRKFGDLFKDFVSSCLVKDRFARPSASSLLAHPFIKKGESSNFLFKSIAKGVVGIGDRFEQDKDRIMGLMKNEAKVENYGQSDRIFKISGWDYNNFLFELEPDEESLGKRVRFCGETIISFREEESKFDIPSFFQRMDSLSGRINGSPSKENKVQVMDSESLAKLLSSLLENIQHQREMIVMLIAQFGYLSEKDLEMTKEMKKLEADLASEKERSFQLELDYEVLKLKLPDSEEEEDDSDN